MASTVLIVEDEPVIADDIRSTIMAAGYTVVGIAATFAEAMHHYAVSKPDLLMVDIQLADGSSGLDFALAIDEVRRTPTLFLTAFPERLVGTKRPDPAYLVTKPFQPETLIHAIDQLLAKTEATPIPSSAQRSLSAAVITALDTFANLEKSVNEASQPIFGDNEGVLASPLSQEEFGTLKSDLSSLLRTEPTSPNVEVVASITQIQSKISDWVLERLLEIQKGFFTNIGKSLADWKLYVGLWLLAAGKLEAVIEAVKHVHL